MGLNPQENIEMNRQHLHNRTPLAKLNHWLRILLVAGMLLTAVGVAPQTLGQSLNPLASVHACANQGGGGDC